MSEPYYLKIQKATDITAGLLKCDTENIFFFAEPLLINLTDLIAIEKNSDEVMTTSDGNITFFKDKMSCYLTGGQSSRTIVFQNEGGQTIQTIAVNMGNTAWETLAVRMVLCVESEAVTRGLFVYRVKNTETGEQRGYKSDLFNSNVLSSLNQNRNIDGNSEGFCVNGKFTIFNERWPFYTKAWHREDKWYFDTTELDLEQYGNPGELIEWKALPNGESGYGMYYGLGNSNIPVPDISTTSSTPVYSNTDLQAEVRYSRTAGDFAAFVISHSPFAFNTVGSNFAVEDPSQPITMSNGATITCSWSGRCFDMTFSKEGEQPTTVSFYFPQSSSSAYQIDYGHVYIAAYPATDVAEDLVLYAVAPVTAPVYDINDELESDKYMFYFTISDAVYLGEYIEDGDENFLDDEGNPIEIVYKDTEAEPVPGNEEYPGSDDTTGDVSDDEEDGPKGAYTYNDEGMYTNIGGDADYDESFETDYINTPSSSDIAKHTEKINYFSEIANFQPYQVYWGGETDDGTVSFANNFIDFLKGLQYASASPSSNLWAAITNFFKNEPYEWIMSYHTVLGQFPYSSTGRYIGIGGQRLKYQSGSTENFVQMNPVTSYIDTINCGYVEIPKRYGNSIDYKGTTLQVYLPFIGVVDLPTKEFMPPPGQKRSIIFLKYYSHCITGECVAVLYKGGDNYEQVLGTYTGNSRIEHSLTGSNYRETVGKLGGGFAGMGAGGAMVVAAMADPEPATKSILSGLGTLLGGAALAGSSLTEKADKRQAGSVGGISAWMTGLKPYLIVGRSTQSQPKEYGQLYGYPANYSTKIGNLSGNDAFFKFATVNLKSIVCTTEERDMINNILVSEGIRT